MKILIPLVSSFGKPGGWRVISELANSWIKKGHQVYFLAPDDTEPYFPTYGEIYYYNYSGKIISKSDAHKKRKTIVGPFENRLNLHKAIDAFPEEVDVLLATHNFTALPVKRSRRKARKFYYIQAYEPEYYEKGPFWYKIYKETARKSYLLGLEMIVNADMYKNYKEIKTDKVVYPGINLNNFYPEPHKKKNEKIILGTIGRTEVYKGTFYILDAIKKLREKYGEKVELYIAFGDKKWEEIDGVKMFFPNGDEELAEFYRKLDVYLSAGLLQLDAIHYPVLESMATKIPLITTGYYPSNNENSWIIPIQNSSAIVDKVEEILQNPIIAEEKANKAFSEVGQFSWDIISEKMLHYFVS
jgi:glycosyltransferase involved in cell wall biosynthesis